MAESAPRACVQLTRRRRPGSRRAAIGLGLLVLACLGGGGPLAAERAPEVPSSLTVAFTSDPPWTLRPDSSTGAPATATQPEGFTVDLWIQLAETLDTPTEWHYAASTASVIGAVHGGSVDVGLVSFPPETPGLGVSALVLADPSLLTIIRQFLTQLAESTTWGLLLTPLGLFLGAAHIRWLADRLGRPEHRQFSGRYVTGITDASWWLISLALEWEGTSVKTPLGRLFDLFWHLGGVVVLAGLIGVLTASLTLQSLEERVTSWGDIEGRPIAVPSRETALIAGLERFRPGPIRQDAPGEAAVERLLRGEVAAVIAAEATIHRLAEGLDARQRDRVTVLPESVNHQRYALVMRPDHPLRPRVEGFLAEARGNRGFESSLLDTLAAQWGLTEALARP